MIDWDHLDPGPVRRVRDFRGGRDRLVADRAGGIRHVLVNGVPIRLDHESVAGDLRPGRLLDNRPGRISG